MPRSLLLVRHGESEGNVAKKLSEKRDHSLFTEAFMKRHSSTFRLTNKGRKQAEMAGDWIRKNVGLEFDRCYTSVYLRAIETACILQLPFAEWRAEIFLRERDWGDLDVVSQEEKETKYKEIMEARKSDGIFWRPPNGESMSNLCIRVDRVIQTMARECSGKNVIVVCHGETMRAFRIILERMSPWEYARLDASTDKKDRILNCQILQYTREDRVFSTNPAIGGATKKSKKLLPHFTWMRSVCPTNTALSSNIWTPIQRKKYSNSDLWEIAEQTKRMIE